MKVIEITKNDWPKYLSFVGKHPLGSIHQTPQWGEFQTSLAGREKFWCYAVEDENGIIMASALIIRQELPFKKCWLYCPRGPLADYHDHRALKHLLKKIRDLARQQNAVFFRFDPPLPQEEKIYWKDLPSRKAHAHYQPENTLLLDLSFSEERLLSQMKPKGRYNIRVAEKHHVSVRASDGNVKDIDAFYRLLSQTTSRDKFSGHNKKFYEDMLSTLHPGRNGHGHDLSHPEAKLYLAEYKDEIVAGIIVTFYRDTAIYYFGASSNEHRNVMAPYLLQWRALLDAKTAGCKWYDFLGIAPQNQPTHPWAGVTDFKLKFGGQRVDYQPAREIVYQPFWYFLLVTVKKIRDIVPF